MKSDFGAWLRQTRKAHGKTQQQVGDAIGRAQAIISDIERGLIHTLTRHDIVQIAAFLEVDESDALRVAGFWNVPPEADAMTGRLMEVWERISTDQRRALLGFVETFSETKQAA